MIQILKSIKYQHILIIIVVILGLGLLKARKEIIYQKNEKERQEDNFNNLLLLLDSINTVPSVPASLAATSITTTTFTLDWTASTDSGNGVWKYTIYRNGLAHMEVYTNTASITGVPAGTSNTWTIIAEDRDRNVSAASSGLVVAQSDTQAPTEPTSLVASDITDTSF